MNAHQRVAIVGVGATEYSYNSPRSRAELAIEAIGLAVADAGLVAGDIDGVLTAHGNSVHEVSSFVDLDCQQITAVVHRGGASVISAMRLAERTLLEQSTSAVVIFRSRKAASEMPSKSAEFYRHVLGAFPSPDYRLAYEFPYGAMSPMQYFALLAQVHMQRYGTTRAQLGAVAVDHRAKAQRNPRAQTYGRELSLDSYLNGRPIVEPLTRYDCCLQTDGGAAFVMTTLERALDLPNVPVVIDGIGEGRPSRPDDFVNRKDLLELGTEAAMTEALACSTVARGDIDAAMIYDAFTNLVIQQLEQLGFCPPGEGGAFVEAGHIAMGGTLPTNPNGGLLAEAHLLGVSHVLHAVSQLRGSAGDCQLPEPNSILVTGLGNFGDAGVAVLRRGDE